MVVPVANLVTATYSHSQSQISTTWPQLQAHHGVEYTHHSTKLSYQDAQTSILVPSLLLLTTKLVQGIPHLTCFPLLSQRHQLVKHTLAFLQSISTLPSFLIRHQVMRTLQVDFGTEITIKHNFSFPNPYFKVFTIILRTRSASNIRDLDSSAT